MQVQRIILIVHPAPHGHGFVGLVPDCQGVGAALTDPDAFVDATIGPAEAVEVAVRGNIAELHAGVAGRIGAVIRYNVLAVKDKAVSHR